MPGCPAWIEPRRHHAPSEDWLKILWTFEDRAKLEKFTAVLEKNEMPFEINSKTTEGSTNQLTVSVEDDDYENAKRLLMRHRRRKTSK